MPITPVDPAVQAAVSGTNLHPTIGQGLDQFAQMQRMKSTQQQQAQLGLFESLVRQTPGLAEYVAANHPDMIAELATPPSPFPRRGQVPFADRLKGIVTAFASQPGPTQAALTGEQETGLRKDAIDFFGGPDEFRRLLVTDPGKMAQGISLYTQGRKALDPAKAGQLLAAAGNVVPGGPVPKQARDIADAYNTLGPLADALGLRNESDRYKYAVYMATGKDAPEMQALKEAQGRAALEGQRLANERARADQDLAKITLGKAQQGTLLPEKQTTELGDLHQVGDTAIGLLTRLDAMIKRDDLPVGTMWDLSAIPAWKARKWNQDVAEFSAEADSLFAPYRHGLVGGAINPQEFEAVANIAPILGKGTSIEQLRAALMAMIGRVGGVAKERLDAFGSIPDANALQVQHFMDRFKPIWSQQYAPTVAKPGASTTIKLSGGNLSVEPGGP